MDQRGIETSLQEHSRVVYTCWPFGSVLCGLATMGIGILLLADHYLDAAPEVLWGLGLLLLGAGVILWTRGRDDWV